MIFTGTRCTTLTKFPVAFSAGMMLNRLPVPDWIELTLPVKSWSGYASTSIVTGWPTRMFVSCVSLKLAMTHTSPGTSWKSCADGVTYMPGSTFLFVIRPSADAVMRQ